jgi:antitoxin component YwqK of YwqJK toxin-antitoxin module
MLEELYEDGYKKLPVNLLIISLTLVMILPFTFCSSPVAFDKLKQKNSQYYLENDNKPFTGKAVKYHKNGRPKGEYPLENGKFHGRIMEWYANGNKQRVIEYRWGKKHGISKGWFSSGCKSYVCRFKDDYRDGKNDSWYKNGQIKITSTFKKGKLDGRLVKYFENGEKQEQAEYKNDILHGNLFQWYNHGQIKLQATYNHGNHHGIVKSFYSNGDKESKKSFNNGIANGEWMTWYKNGKLETKLHYKKGKYHGLLLAWHKNGNLKFSRHAMHNKPIGTWKSWFRDGSSKISGNWRNGSLHGKWIEWYNNSKRKEEIVYDQGQKLNIKQWYACGTLRLAALRQNTSQGWNWRYWEKNGSELMDKSRPFFRGLYPWFFSSRTRYTPTITKAQRLALDLMRRIHSNPVYVMTLNSGYQLESFLSEGIPDQDLAFKDLAKYGQEDRCSTFVTHNHQRQVIFSHNWDFKQSPFLILITKSPHAHSSISVVDVLGMNNISENLHLGHLQSETFFLRAPYYPLEGMNDHGLAVACMYVPGQFVWNPGKATVNMYQIIRLVLDYAANVTEAIELFRNYNNINSRSQHYLVADASGQSAIIEYHDGDIVVIPNTEAWQVATNSLVTGQSNQSLCLDCWRFNTAYERLKNQNGPFTWKQAMGILEDISMIGTPETISSTVYNLNRGQMFLSVGRNYQQIEQFKLDIKKK